jgi:hypothetical protein
MFGRGGWVESMALGGRIYGVGGEAKEKRPGGFPVSLGFFGFF